MLRRKTVELKKRPAGFSLIEVMVALAVMAISALAFLTMFENQLRGNNYLTFKNKSEGVRVAMATQFLSDVDNCGCVFQGAAAIPTVGVTASLNPAALPTIVAPRVFGTPKPSPVNCAAAPLGAPIASTAGLDGIRLNSLELLNLTPIGSGRYQADLAAGAGRCASPAGRGSAGGGRAGERRPARRIAAR